MPEEVWNSVMGIWSLCRDPVECVFDQRDEDVPGDLAAADVAEHDRHRRINVQRVADLLGRVAARALETVGRDNEGDLALFEEVDGGETAGQPAGVDQYHGPDGTVGDLVPHE